MIHGLKRVSLLVYKHNHGLIRVYCPFEVIDRKEGTRKWVQYVVFAPNLPYFFIEGQLLPCYEFGIVLK